MRTTVLTSSLALTLVLSTSGGCKYKEPPKFTESVWFVGGEVDADTLNRGREGYMLYCYACHGENGDGDGPASYALRPPPRDFRAATFKFAGVAEGLPHDEDLVRIIKGGLRGTAMLPWDVPASTLDDIVQYIKWFSPDGEGYREPDGEIGDRVAATAEDDPWGPAKTDAAIERGKKIYHGSANCWSCHSAYVTPQEISDYSKELKGKEVSSFRPALFQPEIKETQYTVVSRSACRANCRHKVCGEDNGCGGTCTKCDSGTCTADGECVQTLPWADDCSQECEGELEVCDVEGACVCIPACDGLACGDDGCGGTCGECTGTGESCVFGTCATNVKALPPDFLFNEVRAGTELSDLYRVIATGIPGTAMPAWKGALPEEDVWAMAYYINSLVGLKGTAQGRALKARLEAGGETK